MPRHKKRSSSVPRPEVLEDRRLLSRQGPDPIPPPVRPQELASPGPSGLAEHVPDRILVRYRDDVAPLSGPHPSGLVPGRSLSVVGGLRVVGIDNRMGVPAALEAARKDPRVLYAEPDFIIRGGSAPDDPRFGDLWGLENTGQSSGTTDADIDAMIAWQQSTGSDDVVVAVIDTGVDIQHPDLSGNLWTNPGEIPGNGIDDDGNGFVDDVHGWDFVNRDSDPWDDNGHGTHVAGTIGAVGNNRNGVTGVAWDVSIMPLKVLDRSGSGTLSGAISAINYAWRNGAVISNASWGGTSSSYSLREAIRVAGESADHLVVAAAGNNGTEMDSPGASKFYPAAYDLPNIVSVAASDRNDRLAWFSNSGSVSVDLAAPGVSILSTMPGGGFGWKSGTSMAAPHVAGASALLRAADPSLGSAELIAAMMDSVDTPSQLEGRTVSGGRLNLGRAMQAISSGPELRSGVVEVPGLGQWTTVQLDRPYSSMVVAATPVVQVDSPSLITRMRNADEDSFELSVIDASLPEHASTGETVWVDDALPSGAQPRSSGGDSWDWVGVNPRPASGSRFVRSSLSPGIHQVYFDSVDHPLSVSQGDRLFAHVYLDPASPPRQVMLQWNDGDWNQRAYWGENLIGWGVDGTQSRLRVGDLPETGGWVRLEVPASLIGLEGKGLRGMAFTLYGGRASWDLAGKVNPEADSRPIRLHYLVAEEGVYTEDASGVKMEARRVSADTADHGGLSSSFVGLRHHYAQRYDFPVVVGQVMTSNDARPSAFWSRGATVSDPPTTDDLFVGMHVGEDQAEARVPETIGYFVFEAGAHHVDGVDLIAGRTGESVLGLDNGSPHLEPLAGLSTASSVVLSSSTMNGRDGAWAALTGNDPVGPDALQMAMVEDRWFDEERRHIAESVSFVVVGQASEPASVGGQQTIAGPGSITPSSPISRPEGADRLDHLKAREGDLVDDIRPGRIAAGQFDGMSPGLDRNDGAIRGTSNHSYPRSIAASTSLDEGRENGFMLERDREQPDPVTRLRPGQSASRAIDRDQHRAADAEGQAAEGDGILTGRSERGDGLRSRSVIDHDPIRIEPALDNVRRRS